MIEAIAKGILGLIYGGIKRKYSWYCIRTSGLICLEMLSEEEAPTLVNKGG